MAGKCTICPRADRKDIDAALLKGETLRGIAAHFGVSMAALGRHKGHIVTAVQKADKRRELREQTLAERMQGLCFEAMDTVEMALRQRTENLSVGLAGANVLRGYLTLFAEMLKPDEETGRSSAWLTYLEEHPAEREKYLAWYKERRTRPPL